MLFRQSCVIYGYAAVPEAYFASFPSPECPLLGAAKLVFYKILTPCRAILARRAAVYPTHTAAFHRHPKAKTVARYGRTFHVQSSRPRLA